MTDSREWRLRIDGKEYGPFKKEWLLRTLGDRELSSDLSRDAVFDPGLGEWMPVKAYLPSPESAPDVFKSVTIHRTYTSVIKAGVILLVLWVTVFTGIRVKTGKWPGEGAHDLSPSTPRKEAPGPDPGQTTPSTDTPLS